MSLLFGDDIGATRHAPLFECSEVTGFQENLDGYAFVDLQIS